MNNVYTNQQNTMLVPGTLKIESIIGKNGEFKVGKVILPFAQVETSDKWLENFEEGQYDGTFVVNRIYVKPIVCKNGAVMNVLKADIPDFNIIESDEGADVAGISSTTIEPIDPAHEEQFKSQPLVTQSEKDTSVPANSTLIDENLTSPDFNNTEVQQLFGPIYGPQCLTLDDLPDLVCFDEDITSDRQRMRELTAMINVNKGGTHKFDPQAKAWNRVRTINS